MEVNMFETIQLVKKNQTPLYLQLANGLAKFIQNGNLKPKTKLPPIRSLAKELKINRDTVVSAYKLLEQRGLVYSQTGSGTFVSEIPKLSSSEHFLTEIKNLINFATVSFSNDYYSIEQFDYISSEILTKEKWNAFYDTSGVKYLKFKQDICKYLQTLNIQSTSKQVRIITHLGQLFNLLSRIYPKPNICIESPAQDFAFLNKYGFKILQIPLENDGISIDLLEEQLKSIPIKYVYITPYLQNPTGVCYSNEKKRKLLELANKYNFYIIEEDSYSNLLLNPYTNATIYSQFSNERVIYINNFSKLHLPKLPYSFVLLPQSLMDIIPDNFTYSFTDALFHYFFTNYLSSNVTNYIVEDCKIKYLKLIKLIDLYLTPYISYSNCLGGIYIWLTLKNTSLSIEWLCNELLSQGIVIAPGTLFYMDTKSNIPHFRISIASVNVDEIEQGILTILKILKGATI